MTIPLQYLFRDVSSGHWAYLFIKDMTARKWLEGYEDDTFQPERFVTRAEFAKLMVLSAGLSTGMGTTASFEDVSPADWYAPYVEAAKPYLTGFRQPNGSIAFKPEEPAVREDIAIGMMKLKADPGSSNTAKVEKFSDYKAISAIARKYIASAVERDLISGFPDGTFRPQEPLTRAQAASILYKAFSAPQASVQQVDENWTPTP